MGGGLELAIHVVVKCLAAVGVRGPRRVEWTTRTALLILAYAVQLALDLDSLEAEAGRQVVPEDPLEEAVAPNLSD
jgi:hypothetical protein